MACDFRAARLVSCSFYRVLRGYRLYGRVERIAVEVDVVRLVDVDSLSLVLLLEVVHSLREFRTGLELYRLTITVSLALFDDSVNQYSNEAKEMAPSFPGSILVAYRFFVFNLTSRYNMIVVSKTSRIIHFFCLGLAAL